MAMYRKWVLYILKKLNVDNISNYLTTLIWVAYILYIYMNVLWIWSIQLSGWWYVMRATYHNNDTVQLPLFFFLFFFYYYNYNHY